ncbi:MAG: Flp pilus assembly complex ATPase component [Verrucomicrobiota bacterium]|jgi:type II secretion system protein E
MLVSANQEFVLEILQESGLVNASQVSAARSAAEPGMVVETLIQQGVLSEEDVARAQAAHASMEFVDVGAITISPEAIDRVPAELAERFKVLPIAESESGVVIAVSDPLDFDTFDTLGHLLGCPAEFVCGTETAIRAGLFKYYGVGSSDPEAEPSDPFATSEVLADGETGDAPIIRMVTSLLMEAYKLRASDIHLEPMDKTFRVRLRIDGVLQEMQNPPKRLQSAIISRLKIMTGTMSIAEKRLPQDGRIQVQVGQRQVDLRVSTVPTTHGESIVMRILDKSSLQLGLPQLGFLSDDQEVFERLITLPDGILLVTGPTGSGKTTTLYACLNYINRPDRKLITVEDPVEYQMAGINQVQVNAEIGMTFPAALRSMLRQAPNIIMVGEIRDADTANIAINASLTGHLVFSTLHTNDAPSAVARLVDIGVQPFLVASAVRAMVAQRLVRKICPKCKKPADLLPSDMRALGVDASQVALSSICKGAGCDHCRNSGYKGRAGIFEIFVVDDEIRHMINDHATTLQLRRRARESGMRTMREDGIRKVLSGMTTAEEVISVTMGDRE